MRTVSTKLDNTLHNKFIEACNEEGKCQSEFLRDIIQDLCKSDEQNEKPTLIDTTQPIITEIN